MINPEIYEINPMWHICTARKLCIPKLTINTQIFLPKVATIDKRLRFEEFSPTRYITRSECYSHTFTNNKRPHAFLKQMTAKQCSMDIHKRQRSENVVGFQVIYRIKSDTIRRKQHYYEFLWVLSLRMYIIEENHLTITVFSHMYWLRMTNNDRSSYPKTCICSPCLIKMKDRFFYLRSIISVVMNKV